MGEHSIKSRLIAAVVVSQIILALALGSFGVWYTRHRLIGALDATLNARAVSIAALVRFPEDDTSTSLVFDNRLVPKPLERKRPDLFQIRVTGQGVVAESPDWTQTVPMPASRSHWSFTFAGSPYRGIRLEHLPILDQEGSGPLSPVTLSVVYAAPMVRVNREVAEAAMYITLASLVTLAAAIFVAVLGIRRGLRPLQELAANAARVSTREWEIPETTERTKELTPLAQAMKEMLHGLRKSFSQQREFLGNAAHELKTPVAVVKSTIQSTLQKPRTNQEYRLAMECALEDLARIEKLLQWMLRLARAEQWASGAGRRDLEIVNLAETCSEATDRLKSVADARNIKVLLSGDDRAKLRADPEDLHLIWANLLDNAIRYSQEGSEIRITVTRVSASRATVTVTDSGPGIPENEIPHLFERFYRADHSRARDTGGFGLGLAIARALTQAYGGAITAASKVGEGTSIIVELPLVPEDDDLTAAAR